VADRIFAGLFSRAPPSWRPRRLLSGQKPLHPLTILFGSQTGNAEALARRLVKEAGQSGFAPTPFEFALMRCEQL
jgi:sulfite reductase alpha subunit-like flavoprotein